MITEDYIERQVERKMNSLDSVFMSSDMSQQEYDEEVRKINSWAEQQYAKMSFKNFEPKMNPVLPLTARREFDTIHPYWGLPHGGIWVVRDAEGDWIDADKYRNDLRERHENLLVEGN